MVTAFLFATRNFQLWYRVSQKKLWIVNYLPPEIITIPSNSIAPQDPFLFPFVTNCIHFCQFPPEKCPFLHATWIKFQGPAIWGNLRTLPAFKRALYLMLHHYPYITTLWVFTFTLPMQLMQQTDNQKMQKNGQDMMLERQRTAFLKMLFVDARML